MRNRFKNQRLAALALIAAKNNMATMAASGRQVARHHGPGISTDDLRVQLNNVITALRIVTAKLDLDAGVTDVNYTALAVDAAIATAPIKNQGQLKQWISRNRRT
jgi:hypothetical protein